MMLFHGVPLDCINQAALSYQVPAALIVSVMEIEKGRNGMAVKNKNGTEDLGVMQINSGWLPSLAKRGITQEKLKNDPCMNVAVGTWILAQGIAKSEGWKGVGNYHSFTPKHNQTYHVKVKATYFHYQRLLEREA